MSIQEKIDIARGFRKNQTSAEKIMWNELRNRKLLNLKFRRQYLIEGYIVDFYCSKIKLVIEIDGRIHGKQVSEDHYRQSVIEGRGIRFIRFSNQVVENNINKVLQDLRDFIKVIDNSIN